MHPSALVLLALCAALCLCLGPPLSVNGQPTISKPSAILSTWLPDAVAVDSSGLLYVIDLLTGDIVVVDDANNSEVRRLSTVQLFNQTGRGARGLYANYLAGVAVDPHSDSWLYVCGVYAGGDYARWVVYKLNAMRGDPLVTLSLELSDGYAVAGIAVGRASSNASLVYASYVTVVGPATNAGVVVANMTDGSLLGYQLPNLSRYDGVGQIAVDSRGRMYVAFSGTRDTSPRVWQLDPQGNLLNTLYAPPVEPYYLAIAADDTLFVSGHDVTNKYVDGTVVRFDSGGTTQPFDFSYPQLPNQLGRIAVDAAGTVLLGSFANAGITRVDLVSGRRLPIVDVNRP